MGTTALAQQAAEQTAFLREPRTLEGAEEKQDMAMELGGKAIMLVDKVKAAKGEVRDKDTVVELTG